MAIKFKNLTEQPLLNPPPKSKLEHWMKPTPQKIKQLQEMAKKKIRSSSRVVTRRYFHNGRIRKSSKGISSSR